MSSRPLRFFIGLPLRLIRLLTNGGFWVAIIGMAGLNVATLTLEPLNASISSEIGAIPGITTVRATREAQFEAAQSAREAQIAEDLVELEKTRTALVDENNWLSGELLKSTDQMASMTADFEARRRTVLEGLDRIAARIESGITRTQNTIAAQSIPYLGIFAVQGAAEMDLRDACQSLEDLKAVGADAAPLHMCSVAIPSRETVLSSVREDPEKVWTRAQQALPDLPDFQQLRDGDLRAQFGPKLD